MPSSRTFRATGAADNARQPTQPNLLTAIKVQPDKAPDCSSLKSIVESVTRDCKTNDEKAIAIYNFCQLALYHRAYPVGAGRDAGPEAHQLLRLELVRRAALGRVGAVDAAGWEHRFVGWNGHTTVEAKYDGRWHYLDVFLKFYAWQPDGQGGRTIASQDELTKNAETLDQERLRARSRPRLRLCQGQSVRHERRARQLASPRVSLLRRHARRRDRGPEDA